MATPWPARSGARAWLAPHGKVCYQTFRVSQTLKVSLEA
jgi:hypothetical protein